MNKEENAIIPKTYRIVAARELARLMETGCGIETAILTTEDGFEVGAQSIKADVDSSKLAAMASSLSAISNMSVSETNLGAEYHSIIIESDYGYIIIMDIALETFPMILNIIADKTAVLGQVLYYARSVVKAFNGKDA